MAFLESGAARVYYEDWGEAGSPVLLLSHGYGSTSQMWLPQREALAQAGWRVLAWDIRGHGRTQCPEQAEHFSHAHTCADMVALLDMAGAERAVVAGLSLGGYMSLYLASRHPERVRALGLFDTGPGYRSDDARAGWNQFAERQAAKLEEQGLEALSDSDEVALAEHESATALALAARGILAQRDGAVMEYLPKVQVPTLVLVGADDKPYHGASDYMAKRIPGAQRAMIPDAGHSANLDQPAAFNEALLGFLRGL